jgi:ribosomal protein S18 acetylase RimI-like enzyme
MKEKPTLDDISIRTELRPGDIGYIAHLHGKLYKDEYDYGIEFESYVAEGLSEFFKSYDPKTNRVWICEHNDEIIGFMLLMNRGAAAQLRYFLISPEYRGIGLGQRLMELYMEYMLNCGYASSYLWTTSDLTAAAGLYKKFGFQLTEEKPTDSFGKKAVLMQKYELHIA